MRDEDKTAASGPLVGSKAAHERDVRGAGPRGAEKDPDLRDTQGGTFDRLDAEGGRQGDQVKEVRTAHEAAQWGADVRSEPEPPKKDALPAGLEHREGPMNKSTGRHKSDPRKA